MSYTLIDIFNLEEKNSYAIIGNSKNAGKTTVLNRLIKDCIKKNKVAGISSIGWDGEIVDRVYKTEKPAVIAPKGTFVATCKQLLPISSSLFKIHLDTSIETILGSIYIIEALNELKVEIVGPRDLNSCKKLISKLLYLSDYLFLDGALNRSSSASSLITDGFILSIVYPGTESLIEFEKSILLFYEKYKKFRILEKEKVNIDLNKLLEKNLVTVGFENNFQFLDFENPIHNEEKILNLGKKPSWIYLPGALTDLTFEKLSSIFVDIDIIIDDFTKNFLSSRVISLLKSRNCNIYYLFSSKLKGITVSTWTFKGYSQITSEKLISIVSGIFNNYPVIDLFYS